MPLKVLFYMDNTIFKQDNTLNKNEINASVYI